MQRVFTFRGPYQERIRLGERLQKLHSSACFMWAHLRANGGPLGLGTPRPAVASFLEEVYHPDLFNVADIQYLLSLLEKHAHNPLSPDSVRLPEGPMCWESLLFELGPSLWPVLLALVQGTLLTALEQLLVCRDDDRSAFSTAPGEAFMVEYTNLNSTYAAIVDTEQRYSEHQMISVRAIQQHLLSIRFLTGSTLADTTHWRGWDQRFPALPWVVLNTMGPEGVEP
jgi:hypothetical protein